MNTKGMRVRWQKVSETGERLCTKTGRRLVFLVFVDPYYQASGIDGLYITRTNVNDLKAAVEAELGVINIQVEPDTFTG